MIDYHVHLWPHVDRAAGEITPASIADYVEAGAERGITEIGFTEHLYRCFEAEQTLGPFWEEAFSPEVAGSVEEFVKADRALFLDEYVAMVLAAKTDGLPVLLGLEVDFFPSRADQILDLIRPYPWDYLIGAVHWAQGIPVDGPLSSDVLERFGARRLWEVYTEWIEELCDWGEVDVLAHVDLPKKFGMRLDVEPLDLYDRLVSAAARNNLAVEVSSQGLRNPAREVYPAPRLLAAFEQAAVPVVFSSDAHAPDEIGFGAAEVRSAARATGYREHISFSNRAVELVPF